MLKILIAVDGSELSLDGVHHALALVGQGLQATMVLANVQEPATLYELVTTRDPDLIAAAKADGRIDEQERQMISAEIGRHTDDPDLQQWLDDEVAKPLDANEVAQSATNPAIAAEMYLASVMLVDDQQDAERAYLDELAGTLQIDPTLQVHLEQQAKRAA